MDSISLYNRITINIETLKYCVSKIFNKNVNHISKWALDSITSQSLNFTTEGVYRIHGFAEISGKEVQWSLVLKIIQPEHVEKNNPQHHNYWKREALVNQSDILTNLPDVINIPKCYKVEEKIDGSVWIWMEEIKGDNSRLWSESDYAFVAHQLGIFNGAYITHQTIPEHSWVCRHWLASWIKSSKRYSCDATIYYPQIHSTKNLEDIWNSYMYLNENIDSHLNTLSKLPRVLAHQDLSKQNMYIQTDSLSNKKLTLIDWQFLSISGLGEDLGKLYGVAMSQGHIPSEQGAYYQDLLFTNYIEGLMAAGWNGKITLPRYGFCASFALRSVWEMPKLIKLVAGLQLDKGSNKISTIETLEHIVRLQMDLGKEANNLMREANLLK